MKRIAFRIVNGLDVAITAHVLANFTNSSVDADLVGGDVVVATLDHESIVPAWDDWQPYMGMRLTIMGIPTSGTLTVQAVVQE
jgi:selenocysteine lyase/cysteine desulfurase